MSSIGLKILVKCPLHWQLQEAGHPLIVKVKHAVWESWASINSKTFSQSVQFGPGLDVAPGRLTQIMCLDCEKASQHSPLRCARASIWWNYKHISCAQEQQQCDPTLTSLPEPQTWMKIHRCTGSDDHSGSKIWNQSWFQDTEINPTSFPPLHSSSSWPEEQEARTLEDSRESLRSWNSWLTHSNQSLLEAIKSRMNP